MDCVSQLKVTLSSKGMNDIFNIIVSKIDRIDIKKKSAGGLLATLPCLSRSYGLKATPMS